MGMSFLKMNDDQLKTVIDNGNITVEFENSKFIKIFKDKLKYELEIAKNDGDWTPGKTCDIAQIAVVNAYNSGKKEGLDLNTIILANLKNDKEEALKELNRRERLRKEGR